MPQIGNFNMEDPAALEKIRRGPHEYVPTEGRHGVYRQRPYVHQEYPKMMDHAAAPDRKKLKGEQEYQDARREWEEAVARSVVRDKAEEDKWLAEHQEAAATARKIKAA